MAITPGFVVTQASTFLLIVLGALVVALRPRTRATIAFGVYSIAAGAGLFVGNLWEISLETEATLRLTMVLYVVAGAAFVLLLATFPRSASRRARIGLCGASLVAIGFSLARPDAVRQVGVLRLLENSPAAIQAPLAVGAVYLAWRFGREPDPRARSQLALMSAGTVPYAAMSVGDALVQFDDFWNPSATGVLLFAATVLWILNIGRWKESSGAARNVALLIPAAALLGMSARAWIGTGIIDDTGLYGIARILAFSILGYAILRHQLLGIDVKLRFAISKSTIAAVFIAVFFVASGIAQQFFADKLGSTYVGIAAAGALVFAMAPLQRAAERLAEKAVPTVAPPAQPRKDPTSGAEVADPETIYRNALRLALRDRRVTRAEEAHLHELAEALGIRPRRAHEILAEIEGEVTRA